VFVVFKIGDLVSVDKYIGIYRITKFSDDGIMANIEQFNTTRNRTTGVMACIPVAILRIVNFPKNCPA
jgi:hypothetical protein